MDVPTRRTDRSHVWLLQAGIPVHYFMRYQRNDQSLHDMVTKQRTSHFCKSSKCVQIRGMQRRPQQLGNLQINNFLSL